MTPFIKRALDWILSFLALIVLAPLMAAIAATIWLDSSGSPIYISDRVGKNGQRFRCFKFRTMAEGAELMQAHLAFFNERDAILFKLTHDPRVTRFGKFLRKYSLDELPQLWNVVRGEMSLVGPRPPLISEVRQYAPEHMVRLSVLPGLTGLWQVQSRQDPSFDAYIALDRQYVENWSLLLDLKILMRTPLVVLRGTGC